jgi:6-phosphogluconate dehydrogenase
MGTSADIGLIGLGVMGENLVLNMDDHGFTVVVFNRTLSKVDEFLNGNARGRKIIGSYSIKEFIQKLKRPRRVMMMVKAGKAVDQLIDQLIPLLDENDIIIDGGNANYKDSMRVASYLQSKKILYVGSGVSGGEEGARLGPSLMPGGSYAAWPHVKEIFQKIAAKAIDGAPCCEWIGESGSGHFVKMVHNGIEYGDMQLISEAYDLMRSGLNMPPEEIAQVFKKWNKGKLNSYLIDITGEVLSYKDEADGYLIDKILDSAGQKGTGVWTSLSALESGIPLTLISEAVFARFLSALKDERVFASKILSGPDNVFSGRKDEFIDDICEALYASKIISYAQGYMLFRQTSKEFGWNLNYGAISMIWREGCIIRAAFLEKIKEAFESNPGLTNLLLDPYFKEQINYSQKAWRRVIVNGVQLGIPLPCISSALNFFDGFRNSRLPANLLQGQRDYFGAHTYERIDKPRGQFFHTNWISR